ncbi:transcription elongation factor GreA [Candidatus Uhrbacteria bacterium CG_4_10_14_0_2_um_filter_41_7]|uniref:Transcription elongation factor GreA n=1 Tax=Candidatus Uhrbacteria bacterium CG_4_9_14_3_um_filter_41_35 TaxID=1975034 RepID=A0A2M7XF05_9BACT|nr:MAG: transcription elongation factor GreA [Candidatus Uhrbacteria bacterium CG11_big_fil_rev_8_21_14_0_20_41_9]PIZ55537.1 MAG: transcription elongation factor GreA [Candidatus Uhrbacteria bacterium CG_4_10_14_0_2_um_filter_41_7]PJA46454.1 MAG: transcription elongation factor GreA [Candidatus Uhrbacteria bacterium CG_4_9_14_3_um_filter_41_35]
MQIPKRKSEEDRRNLAGPVDNYVTRARLEGWKKELIRLKTVDHRPAAEEVARTQAMGDLSENAGYQDAKWRLRKINARILSLNEMIKNAVVIETGTNPDGSIKVGSTVILEQNGQENTFIILGTSESNPLQGRISYSSPLGSLLLNKHAGDTVQVKTLNAEINYKILRVS